MRVVETESSVVFKASRREWAVVPVSVVLSSAGLILVLLGGHISIRWWGVGVLIALEVLIVMGLARRQTVLTKEGLTCNQHGRPWRPWPVTVSWGDVAAIHAARYAGNDYPALYLVDGSLIYARLPMGMRNPRFAEGIALMQRWHLEAGGTGVVPASPVLGPDRSRRNAVFGVCGVLIALGSAGTVTGIVGTFDDAPEVAECSLVPAGLVQGLAVSSRTKVSCNWSTGHGDTGVSLLIVATTARYAKETLETDRHEDLVRYVIRDLPGVTGYFWTEITTGISRVTARGREGGYLVKVEVVGGDQAATEQRAGEVLKAVQGRLRGRS